MGCTQNSVHCYMKIAPRITILPSNIGPNPYSALPRSSVSSYDLHRMMETMNIHEFVLECTQNSVICALNTALPIYIVTRLGSQCFCLTFGPNTYIGRCRATVL